MAFHIKQENYQLRPTAEQRKVFLEAWRMSVEDIPPTRIEAHLRIRELLGFGNMAPTATERVQYGERKAAIKLWRAARMAKRRERAARRSAPVQAVISAR